MHERFEIDGSDGKCPYCHRHLIPDPREEEFVDPYAVEARLSAIFSEERWTELEQELSPFQLYVLRRRVNGDDPGFNERFRLDMPEEEMRAMLLGPATPNEEDVSRAQYFLETGQITQRNDGLGNSSRESSGDDVTDAEHPSSQIPEQTSDHLTNGNMMSSHIPEQTFDHLMNGNMTNSLSPKKPDSPLVNGHIPSPHTMQDITPEPPERLRGHYPSHTV